MLYVALGHTYVVSQKLLIVTSGIIVYFNEYALQRNTDFLWKSIKGISYTKILY